MIYWNHFCKWFTGWECGRTFSIGFNVIPDFHVNLPWHLKKTFDFVWIQPANSDKYEWVLPTWFIFRWPKVTSITAQLCLRQNWIFFTQNTYFQCIIFKWPVVTSITAQLGLIQFQRISKCWYVPQVTCWAGLSC